MRFGALGGSASPDRWMRRVAPYRWQQEPTTQQDLDRLLDVLICHDAPAGTTGLVSGLPWEMPQYLQHEADTVQALVRSAVDATEPALVFHGHWHQQNRCRLNNGRSEVVGLATDRHPASAAIVSIPTLEARYAHRGAENSIVGVDLQRCQTILNPRVPNLVPIPGITGSAHCAVRPLEGPRDLRTAGPVCHSRYNPRRGRMMMAVIGIDSHKDTLAGCLIDAAGEAVEHRSIPNTAAGHAELVVWARTEPHRGLRRFWSVLGFARSACLIFDGPYSGDRRRAHLWAVRLSARRVSAVAAAAHGGVERAGQNSSLKPLHVHRVAA